MSLAIARGEFVAIVGHNGAGKSTLLKILANWIKAESGSAFIDGVDIRRRLDLVRRVGFAPEMPNLFENFSVEYNLKLFTRLFRLPLSRVDRILSQFNLNSFRKSKVQTLSKGLKQRVSLGRALLAEPAVLLLDEPTSGLDFESTKELHGMLRTLHAAGQTILFTTHRSEEVRTLATRMIVLHRGQVAFDGEPKHMSLAGDLLL